MRWFSYVPLCSRADPGNHQDRNPHFERKEASIADRIDPVWIDLFRIACSRRTGFA